MTDKIYMVSVKSKDELLQFVKFPWQIYKNDVNWPCQDDEKMLERFLPDKNIELKYLEIQPFLVKCNEEVVGRICGIICPAFNQHWEKRVAYFGYFESINDQAVASRLFDAVKEWAKSRNCTEIWGPLNPTTSDTVGFLLNKFEERPVYGYPYNPSYYPTLCSNYGFGKEKDLIEMTCPVSVFTANARRLINEVKHLENHPEYTIRPLRDSQLHQEYIRIAEIHPRCFSAHWGYRKIEHDEFITYLSHNLHSISGKLAFVVEHSDNLIGFCLFHLDKNEPVQDSGLPSKIRISVMGLDPLYHRTRIGQWMYIAIANWMENYDFETVNFGWIEEANIPSLNAVIKMGGAIDKSYRVFSLQI